MPDRTVIPEIGLIQEKLIGRLLSEWNRLESRNGEYHISFLQNDPRMS